jgi:hypothetical protein
MRSPVHSWVSIRIKRLVRFSWSLCALCPMFWWASSETDTTLIKFLISKFLFADTFSLLYHMSQIFLLISESITEWIFMSLNFFDYQIRCYRTACDSTLIRATEMCLDANFLELMYTYRSRKSKEPLQLGIMRNLLKWLTHTHYQTEF